MDKHLANHPIPQALQSDHLLLLIGANPLPNLIAARLLAAPDATIWLLHSGEERGGASATEVEGTLEAARRLERKLKDVNPTWMVRLVSIHDSDNFKIESRLRELLEREVERGKRVGLNYTGGTKPMATHTYRTVESMLKSASPAPVFSYLDPRELALRIDRRDGADVPPIKLSFANLQRDEWLRRQVNISIDELAELHGYERLQRSKGWAQSDTTPILKDLCGEIAKIHASPSTYQQWHTWAWSGQCKQLPDQPGLRRMRDLLDAWCGGEASETEVAKRLLPNAREPKLSACAEWFRSFWLEEHCLLMLRELAPRFQLESYANDLYYRGKDQDDFNLDVAATLGYQLFAISCTVASDKMEAKGHFIEAFVRARQLGGDEARAGLVCRMEDPKLLERELARTWDAKGKVRVFGLNDLRDLRAAFADWFLRANA